MHSPYRIIAILVAIATIAYLTGIDENESQIVNVSRFVSKCPLHTESCLLLISESERLELSLSPPNLPSLESLELRINSKRVASANLLNLSAWLEGRDMDMGHHYFQFVEQVAATDQLLTAIGMIPICNIDRDMVWKLVVEYEFQGNYRQLTFELDKLVTAS